MIKTFKNAIAMLMTVAMLVSLVPTSIVAEVPTDEKPVIITIPFENYGHARGDSSNAGKPQKYTVNTSYKNHYINTNGSWVGYAQLDLSGYEEILQNPNTKTKITLKAGNGFTSYAFNFNVYVAPDAADGYDRNTVCYNDVAKLGIDDTTRPIIASRTDDATVVSDSTLVYNDGIKNGTVVSLDADRDNLVNALGESDTNGLVTIFIKGTANTWYKNSTDEDPTTYGTCFTMADKNGVVSTGLVIEYYESEIDNDAYLESLKEDFTWDRLSSDSAGDFKTSLPNYFRGASIAWSSDNENLNISSDGTLKRPRGGDVSATLTANLRLGESSTSHKFDVVAPVLLPVTKKVKATSATTKQIGVKYPDEAYPTTYSAFYMNSTVMYSTDNNDRHTFVKIDLSDSLKELEVATKVTFNLVNRNSSSTTNAMVTVLSDRYDEWDATLTYNGAINNGMYTDPGYGIAYGARINKLTNDASIPAPIDTPEFMQAIKNAVAANPDEGLVTFRISSRDWNQIAFQLSGTAGWHYVEITYYEEDLMTDDELKASKKDKLQWTALTSQDIDNVVADLTLPATWYGAPVTWSTSDENVISSSGEVTIGSVAKNVTLTATVDGAVNTFNVTVPSSKIATNGDITHKVSYANGGANLNYSEANIYANEDIEGTPDVIIASYNKDGILVDITVKDNVTIKKGYNCFPSDYHYLSGNSITTKAIVVDDIITLKPLAVAK